jgi:hypothetical protein
MGIQTRALADMKLQRAIQWISERLAEQPGTPRGELVDRASQEFNLTPLQAEFLYHMHRQAA